jgi:transposase
MCRPSWLRGVRVYAPGNARKTDATAGHAVVMVALRTPRLSRLGYDEELIALRLLTDRRDELSRLRVQTVNRLHRRLTELIHGAANKRDLSALQARRLVATLPWMPLCLSSRHAAARGGVFGCRICRRSG